MSDANKGGDFSDIVVEGARLPDDTGKLNNLTLKVQPWAHG